MLVTNKVEKLEGKMTVPGDKSISHRAIMLSSISKGTSRVKGFLRGEDCLSTISCFRDLGIDIEDRGTEIIIQGKGLHGLSEPLNVLDAGNSGTTIRLISGILAGQKFLTIVTGDASLRKRPMERIATPLRKMGAFIEGRDYGNLAPLVIRGGNLKGMDYASPVSSAQVKSAILLAGLYGEGDTIVREKITSRDHTEKMLKGLGANISTDQGVTRLGKSELYGQSIEVPGDISSAAFFMAGAAALPGSFLITEGVGLNPTRTGIIDVLRDMGGDIEIHNLRQSGGEEIGDIMIRGKKLYGTEIGKEIIPRLIDEIPVLAIIAATAEGKTIITGAEELKVKESNRITAMVTEMQKVGIKVTELPDGMEIEGGQVITGGRVESYGDHRIAMAMAICGLFAQEPIKINDSQCIDISFPNFEEKLKAVVR
ncbi:3-phosphoshikimate 1-carboxyvinyltransferase [Alkaliphilus metalliredigens QYMF]|uniref:3-phosphoshikimate 1-carboxyvinyltransferase n=1 Tax=Alkaliphilus metalliredigens (strain QYMF) TaxID=293826 RepID=AROA_ALKMQ|nr:3-phosphoshikimate 1-carboxyvinyltransferase [Alkaliphilus metalliredigens]A6TL04.1 RecName: Full=3-phosphoshikimate 1-carboxyvinyltransferase; AltName: Full=5-enolpyruvylshikimate-3-phosphate synthase; Short=EPSP synthase; Short=EPSPS [Alkaliphilus metalliredigens QYMF]ABR46872.1 3-phosphoshikimate 1-carboxyvinyltransferase [Alkaliphilus metalliredigens QYMF]